MRRTSVREEVSAERWMVSYADFITLLLAFFVVMYSISSVNEGKYRVLSESLSGIFRGAEFSLDPVPVGDLARPALQRDIGLLDRLPRAEEGGLPADENLQALESDAKKRFQELIADGKLSISANSLWMEIEIGSSLLFPSGSAAPVEAADPVLESLGRMLAPYPNPVQVAGYTDNQPLESGDFTSNWELSAARAAAVVRWLNHYGVTSERLTLVGHGANNPKASNQTPGGRRQNRRVKVVVARNEAAGEALRRLGQALEAASVEEPAALERVEMRDGDLLFRRQAP